MLTKAVNIFAVAVLFVLVISIFVNSMTKPIGHDEHMYCTAGALLSEGKMIYKDFSYVAQLPYHPALCALLYKVFATDYYLLAGRVLSAVCDTITILAILYIFCRVLNSFAVFSKLFGLGAVVWYVFNPIVDYANGFAWNHDLVTCCVVVSFAVFITTDFRRKVRYIRFAVMGVVLGFACWSRMTTGLVYLVFLVVLLSTGSDERKARIKNAAVFLVATIAVSVWPLYVIMSAPRAFFIDVFLIPMLNGEWLHRVAPVSSTSELFFECLSEPAYLTLLLTVIYICAAVAAIRRKLYIHSRVNALLPAALTIIFFGSVFIPPTMFKQYFAVPALFLIIGLAYPLRYLLELRLREKASRQIQIAGAIFAVSIMITVGSHLDVLSRLPALVQPSGWPAVRLHRISNDIAKRSGSGKRILTLGPLYALEGGCDIYPQFSAGSFVYRIAPFMKREALEMVNGAGPGELAELLEEQPASAVILGVEPEVLEEPLFNMAVGDDWEKHVYEDGITVYFKPRKVKVKSVREKKQGYI